MRALVLSITSAVLTCQAGIISITSGDSLVGNRAANLIQNGSFEARGPGQPAPPANVSWAGDEGMHTGGSPGGPTLPIPGWDASYGPGAYGWWGALGFQGAPLPHGEMGLYFGNFFTTPSVAPTFEADGVVTFASPPTFTNQDPNNQSPVVLSQTVNGLTAGAVYTLDFWTSGEANATGFTGAGVFAVDITGEDRIFLTTPAANSQLGLSQRYYIQFQPVASSVTFSFINWGHLSDNNATELVLDDVILNGAAVPEPSTALLAAGSLAALAVLRRRR
jgi:hypothetical protein